MKKSLILSGETVVDGIVIEKAIVSNPEKISITKCRIKAGMVHGEQKRYREALKKVKKILKEDQRRILDELGNTEADILQSHIMITQDPFFTDEVPSLISSNKKNAEWVIVEGLHTYLETFRNIDNIYFKERGRDIEDVSLRIIKTLQGDMGSNLIKDREGVLVVRELVPSMIIYIDTEKIKGIVSEFGSETSHATILAKSLGIPVIIDVKGATLKIETGDLIIVDGHVGRVLLTPSERVVKEYEKIQDEYKGYLKTLEENLELPATTLDHENITLQANIEFITGADIALRYGAEGVGLFRTELPFIIHNKLLSEREQYTTYTTLMRMFRGKPVTIRTLDMGGDKFFPFQQSTPLLEPNPFLGLRSIRVSLQKPEIFKVQIRALLRASGHGPLSILLPMISSYEDMEKALEIIEEEKEVLMNSGIPFDENMRIGIMIEIPSAALASEHLIELCDFFSIGTNDLIQYTLAVDRTNENVASYYLPENPAVLRLIEFTARTACKYGKPCAVCGELAGNPFFTPFFIGSGIRQLSMEPLLIPQIKKLIRRMKASDASDLTEQILACKKVGTIKKKLLDFFNAHGESKSEEGSSV
jgi:phosphotransferase system enzyme I (PtsI)